MDQVNHSGITMSHQQQNPDLKVRPTPKLSSTNGQSPKIGTPMGKVEKENGTGWTPYFAEEYSVFNSTPGRLTNCVTFTFNSPIQSQGISRREATSELNIPVDPSVESHSLLRAGIQSQHPTSCDSNTMTQGIFFSGSVTQCVTPKPVKKYANEILTGQTATPPASASQTSRKLEFNYLKENVHRDIQYIYTSPTAMRQSTKSLVFLETDLSHQDSFKKDVTTSITDFRSPKDDIIFSSLHNRIDSQFDWTENILTPRSESTTFGRVNDIPIPCSEEIEPQSFNNAITDIGASVSKRGLPDRLENYDEPSDCFLNASISGVNPGLLVSRKSSISMSSTSLDTKISQASSANPSFEPLIPYEHQRRESIRSQEERSRRQSFPHRQNPFRPISKQRTFSHKSVANTRPLKKAQRNEDINSRDSDLPHMKCLFSMPSSACRQTELRLIVDSSGRARTETIITKGKKREAIICAQEPCGAKIFRRKTQLDEKSSSPPALNRYITLSQHFSPTEISMAKISQEEPNSNFKFYTNNPLIDDFSSSDTESNALSHRNLGDATLELWEVIKSRKKKWSSVRNYEDNECFSETF